MEIFAIFCKKKSRVQTDGRRDLCTEIRLLSIFLILAEIKLNNVV